MRRTKILSFNPLNQVYVFNETDIAGKNLERACRVLIP